MKKIVSLAILTLTLWSCYPSKSTLSGLENVSFIELYGTADNYEKMVDVYIDDQPAFKAVVNQKGKNTTKTTNYQLPTGKHSIRIVYSGQELFKSEVFLTSQITKKITLK